jgi:hypothetical protein
VRLLVKSSGCQICDMENVNNPDFMYQPVR